MLTYFVSQSNSYSIRVDALTSTNFTMSLQDMTTLTDSTASLSDIGYDGYESVLSFTAEITGSIIGEEYRAKLYTGDTPIWHGSIQVYKTQTVDKSNSKRTKVCSSKLL
jgi:hypothetical protein